MKVAKISGCRDCPYNQYFETKNGRIYRTCVKKVWNFGDIDVINSMPDDYVHEDCKLPDLPTNSEIIDFKTGDPNPNFNDGFISGANFVIEKISGSNS